MNYHKMLTVTHTHEHNLHVILHIFQNDAKNTIKHAKLQRLLNLQKKIPVLSRMCGNPKSHI